ncbi:MAG: 30S ribosomal protein S7 [Candidatus Gracilibacteria bacterium]|jgi:small subunit ribosomal protein S7|nr:30S ribosomal protein S7 [Candidatus Gracilibacteria bacterium]
MAQKKAVFIPSNSTSLQEKFICCLMHDGKKTVARRVFNDTMEAIKAKGHKKPEEIFEKALRNIMPQIEVRPRRVGGSIYQVPVEVKPHRQQTLAIRWVLQATRGKKGSSMSHRLAAELIAASAEDGAAFKKREDVHKMAKANRAFAHFGRY